VFAVGERLCDGKNVPGWSEGKTPMSKPLFAWCDGTGLGRNVFVFFRRTFTLADEAGKLARRATLYLFADTRYRLWVNGAIVAYGPARFLPSHPEYDTVDLRPWLRKGANALVVEANSFGANNFEAMPSVGGFIAWGGVRTPDGLVDLSTPGEWKMLRAEAWDEEASAYSFAQAPAEIVDMREVPAGVHGPEFDDRDWLAPVPVECQDAWGELEPRSIPMLTMDLSEPEKILVHSPLADGEEVVGARVPGEKPDAGGRRVRCCFGTYIFSPREQDVALGAFWGPLFLNGQEIASVGHAVVANRLDYPVWLRAGWNFLYGEPEIVSTRWGILIALPSGKGLVAAAERDVDCSETMVFSRGVPEDVLRAARSMGVPSEMSRMPVLDVPWHKARRGEPIPLPARLSGWDTPVSRAVEQPNAVRDLRVPAGRDWVLLFDFGKQFMGHVALDVESGPGTILDVVYDERLRADGLAAIFRANPASIDNADRFVTSGGRQRIEGFRSRGARYVQIAVRSAAEPVTLHNVAVRNTLYPMAPEGRFECSDPVLNWIWSTGVETIRITMETVLNADSWRERGMYCNDTVVIYNSLATFCRPGGHRARARCISGWPSCTITCSGRRTWNCCASCGRTCCWPSPPPSSRRARAGSSVTRSRWCGSTSRRLPRGRRARTACSTPTITAPSAGRRSWPACSRTARRPRSSARGRGASSAPSRRCGTRRPAATRQRCTTAAPTPARPPMPTS
jgi:alpha-L-rhamnosidase